jgi:hypothetical protein
MMHYNPKREFPASDYLSHPDIAAATAPAKHIQKMHMEISTS